MKTNRKLLKKYGFGPQPCGVQHRITGSVHYRLKMERCDWCRKARTGMYFKLLGSKCCGELVPCCSKCQRKAR